jgi:quinol monooxygenase YgiN
MSYTGPSFSVHITLYIDPNQLPTFFEMLKPFHDAVSAEPECIFVELYQSPDKPGVFKFVENWNASVEWMTNVCI